MTDDPTEAQKVDRLHRGRRPRVRRLLEQSPVTDDDPTDDPTSIVRRIVREELAADTDEARERAVVRKLFDTGPGSTADDLLAGLTDLFAEPDPDNAA